MRSRPLWFGLIVLVAAVTGCGDDDDDSGGGGELPGRSFADAAEIAAALDCTDTFNVTDQEPMMGPVPTSAGYCDAEGSLNMEVYGSPEDVEGIIRDFPADGCTVLQAFGIDTFIGVAGPNWMATVQGEPDAAASERVASTLDGEVHEFDCS